MCTCNILASFAWTRLCQDSKACQACVRLRVFLSNVPFYHESGFCILISKKFTKFDRKWPHFMFFDYKVPTQKHFKPRSFWKNAGKLRIATCLASLAKVPFQFRPFKCGRAGFAFCGNYTFPKDLGSGNRIPK